jgi:hypothetical protein
VCRIHPPSTDPPSLFQTAPGHEDETPMQAT